MVLGSFWNFKEKRKSSALIYSYKPYMVHVMLPLQPPKHPFKNKQGE